MAPINLPAYCTNPDCGERVSSQHPAPVEPQQRAEHGRVYRLARTWTVAPRAQHTEWGVTLTVLDRQLVCQECHHKGELGKPSKENGEVTADQVHHL